MGRVTDRISFSLRAAFSREQNDVCEEANACAGGVRSPEEEKQIADALALTGMAADASRERSHDVL